MLVESYDLNTLGNDYVVGDIHGCYPQLYQKLADMDFNKDTDRLFCVGDLVDRGEYSLDCLDILAEPWFHTVRGNHDQMAIDWATNTGYPMSSEIYIRNGGKWFIDLDIETQKIIAFKFDSLPIIIEVETDLGLVGIIHADCPFDDWKFLKALINAESQEAISACMWNRDRFYDLDQTLIKGVYKVFHGHTSIKFDIKLGNRHYIDTGAVYNNFFTVIKL